MDKQTLQEHAGLLDEVAGLIIRLAGNLQRAEGLIRDTDKERPYNEGARYWDTEGVVAVLHRVQLLKTDLEGELDAVIYAERKGNTPGQPVKSA
jgi:hypothetical protein